MGQFTLAKINGLLSRDPTDPTVEETGCRSATRSTTSGSRMLMIRATTLAGAMIHPRIRPIDLLFSGFALTTAPRFYLERFLLHPKT